MNNAHAPAADESATRVCDATPWRPGRLDASAPTVNISRRQDMLYGMRRMRKIRKMTKMMRTRSRMTKMKKTT